MATAEGMRRADIAMVGGVISAIDEPGTLGAADEMYDATGRYVLPGVIDGHVHFREPGLEYKEDFGTGSRSAVMGGVTTVFDMPNTKPPTDSAVRVREKQKLAEAHAYCDFGIIAAIVDGNLGEIPGMAETGVVGFKCFLGETTGAIPPPTDGTLLEAMAAVARTGRRFGFHAENNEVMQHLIAQAKASGRTDALAHLDTRPVVAEVEAIQRVCLFAKHTKAKIHIFHLSSRDGLETVLEWRRKGVDVTCETAPHYCFLSSEDMRRLGSIVRMNPPVREPGHADALFAGLVAGAIDAIATDHSPHTPEEKINADIWRAVSGWAGVETSLRLFLTHGVNEKRMTLSQLARASSEGPARAWGLYPRKGAIRVGSDADLTVVDLEQTGVITAAQLHGKNDLSPWEGRPTKGEAVATILRGRVVMRDGELMGGPRGRMVQPGAA